MQWAARVREWKQSGQTLRQFVEGKPFKPSTLRWWSTRLRQRREESPKPEVRMMPVRISGHAGIDESAPALLFVEVGGARIGVRHGFDAELLRKVIAALAGQPR
jgi:hypothetical protein